VKTPVTRQCCGVSAVAGTTRAAIEMMPSPAKVDKALHALLGVVSATAYFARERSAFVKGCAPAARTDVKTNTRASHTRMNVPFQKAAESLAGIRNPIEY
jgi:hypothetical protein